jgi:predicted transcriptional regulator
MKRIKFINHFLTALLLLAILNSCHKENSSNTGNLKISFANHPADLTISIFSLDNSQISIFNGLKTDGSGIVEKELNIGNYFVSCSTTTSPSYDVIGFQIKSGETTFIYYDENNSGHQ